MQNGIKKISLRTTTQKLTLNGKVYFLDIIFNPFMPNLKRTLEQTQEGCLKYGLKIISREH